MNVILTLGGGFFGLASLGYLADTIRSQPSKRCKKEVSKIIKELGLKIPKFVAANSNEVVRATGIYSDTLLVTELSKDAKQAEIDERVFDIKREMYQLKVGEPTIMVRSFATCSMLLFSSVYSTGMMKTMVLVFYLAFLCFMAYWDNSTDIAATIFALENSNKGEKLAELSRLKNVKHEILQARNLRPMLKIRVFHMVCNASKLTLIIKITMLGFQSLMLKENGDHIWDPLLVDPLSRKITRIEEMLSE